jgi:hypothetical protein
MPDRDERVDAALAEYLAACDAGNPPQRAAFLARFPDLADSLATFLDDHERMLRAADPERTGGQAPAQQPLGTVRYVGDYELLEEIGRGGMGVVYRARHEELGREVALKLLTAGVCHQPGGRDRFEQESQVLARLDHPGIVPVYGVGEDDGQTYFAMKLIQGPDLRARFAALREGLAEGVGVLVAVCRAVQFAHDRGIIHRDLKPANILQDSEGAVFVTDFGLAYRLDRDQGLTATGALVGTPAYMAPEQITGETKIGPEADVWALGVILYELLTGRLPFQGETPLETLHLIQGGLKARPRDVEPGADRVLERVCLSCLQQHPKDRYRAAAALADDLERWLAHRDVSTPRRNRLRWVGRWVRGLKRPRVLAPVVAVVVLATCAWLVNREVQRAAVDRAELEVTHGRLDSARRQVSGRDSLLSRLTLDPGVDVRQDRLRSLLDEHLYGNLDEPGSSGDWNWSSGGRWLGRGELPWSGGVRGPPPGGGGTGKFLVGWDGWTGGRQPGPVPRVERSVTLFGWDRVDHDHEVRKVVTNGWPARGWTGERSNHLSDVEKEAERLVRAARKTRWFPPSAGLLIGTLPVQRTGGKRFILLPFVNYRYTVYSQDNRFLHFFWQPYHSEWNEWIDSDLQSPLIQATYDNERGRWVRLVDSDLRVYRPTDEQSDFHAVPPDATQCQSLGRPRVLDLCDGPGGPSRRVLLRLSPDGTRLLTVWRRGGAVHVWRMPGSEVTK